MPQIVAAEDPELATAMINQMLSEPEPKAQRPVSQLPDTHVELPGGYLNLDTFTRDAEVRELTGFDEEELSKASTTAQFIKILLQRGVVRIGDEKPTETTFSRMLAGDRDTLIFAIRKATYGTKVETSVQCPHCTENLDIEIDLDTDVEIARLESASDRQFTVKLSRGEALVHLPDGETEQALLAADGKTAAELNTLVLKRCVEEINGTPVLREDDVKRLSIRDRQTLMDAINAKKLGPQLGAVREVCPFCEEDIKLPLSLLGLLRF